MKRSFKFMVTIILFISLLLGCSSATNSSKDKESNHTENGFVYCVDVASLSTFLESIPKSDIIKLQVTGTYSSFMNKINLFKDENKQIDLDLSKLEKPLQSIGGFDKCRSLVKLTLPKGVVSIYPRTFLNCSNLKTVILPEGITTIGQEAFYGCGCLTDIVLPKSLTTIGEDAFCCCHSLETISIPDNVTSIGDDAFWCCDYLSNVKLPATLTSINRWFTQCYSLETIEIPNTVTSIRSSFKDCTKLSYITIPAGVTQISSAFVNCTNLKTVMFEAPQNWNVERNGVNFKTLEKEELQDSTNAANLLRETYADFNWTRN